MIFSHNTFDGSLRSAVKNIRNDLDSENLNSALKKIYKLVERVITEPICVSAALASRDLDKLCIEIGENNLKNNVGIHNPRSQRVSNRQRVAYIVTRLQGSGGHSRLLLDFIRSQPDKDHIILSTGLVGVTEKKFLNNPLIIDSQNVSFIQAPNGNFESRLTWLQRTLLESEVSSAYLFNHHQDSVAVAALVPDLNIKGFFCHHGDHHLCLGVHLQHLIHIDFHPMGYHHCRNELGIQNLYLPLTCSDKDSHSFDPSVPAHKLLTTATAARSNKIEIPYYISYTDLVPRVLKVTGGRHIHIGKLSRRALRRIYSQMHILGLDSKNFVYIEWTPSVWKILQEFKVDLYLASFPYGAGLTLIEVLGAGIPVVLHQHIYSRVLSGFELSYPESFHWDDPDKLLSYLAGLKPQDLFVERILARKHYEAFHRSELLVRFLRNPDAWELETPPLAQDFKPRWDEWAIWVAAQQNVSALMYRFRFRAFRMIRAFISQFLAPKT